MQQLVVQLQLPSAASYVVAHPPYEECMIIDLLDPKGVWHIEHWRDGKLLSKWDSKKPGRDRRQE